MSKGLEALESLMADYYEMCQDLGNNDDQYQRCNQTSERAIIEKELKRLEDIDYILKTGGGIWAENGIVSKKLKALEIIKKKRVNVDNFLNHIKNDTEYKEYKRLCGLYKIMVFSEELLTQEEYDLLKEVLHEKAAA